MRSREERFSSNWRLAAGEDDLRYQYRLMVRWCRLFRKSDLDWVHLVAKRYRDRHPLFSVEMRIAA